MSIVLSVNLTGIVGSIAGRRSPWVPPFDALSISSIFCRDAESMERNGSGLVDSNQLVGAR